MSSLPNSGPWTTGTAAPREPLLSRVLAGATEPTFGSLAHLPSNLEAIQCAERFAAGLYPFAAIVGPSGWGKSHLLSSVAARLALQEGLAPASLSATEWALGMGRAESSAPLLLDNVQDALERSRLRQALRLGLERRVKAGRSTLLCFTGAKISRAARNLLPAPRVWAWATLAAPEPAERVLILREIALVEGLALGDRLAGLIAHRMRGNGRTLSGALKRLKLQASVWEDDRAALRACGILDPFFRDAGDWDVRDAVHCAADRDSELATYVMLREACLAEASVAQFYAIDPAAAYRLAERFARRLQGSAGLQSDVDRVILSTVRAVLEG